MENREIKFRVFDGTDFMSSPFTLQDLQSGKTQFASYCPVMQYTGLKDKNGKEIYDGDIIELFGWGTQKESDGFTVVEWDAEIMGWGFRMNTYAEDRYDFLKAVSHCVVVGNIYENPELLSNPGEEAVK